VNNQERARNPCPRVLQTAKNPSLLAPLRCTIFGATQLTIRLSWALMADMIFCRKCKREKDGCLFQPRDVKAAIRAALERADKKLSAICRMCRRENHSSFRITLHGRKSDSRSSLKAVFSGNLAG